VTEKIAIVTAAGRGIGEAIARELAGRGYRLALMSNAGGAVRLAKELGGIGLQGSVTEETDMRKLVDATLDRYGRIDAVVNNTGRLSEALKRHGHATVEEDTLEQLTYDADLDGNLLQIPDVVWQDAFDLAVLHVVRMCRHVTQPMVRQGGGAIVNISGLESVQPRLIYPMGPVRLALHGYTKLYADRYGRDGIRMNTVLPGMMENGGMDPEEIRRSIPLGRAGTLAELAKTVAFLLSADAGYITGQNILVDGAINRGL